MTTATGYTGYMKEIRGIRYICVHKRRKELSKTHNYNMKDDKITLAWFQVSGVAGNSGIDNNIVY